MSNLGGLSCLGLLLFLWGGLSTQSCEFERSATIVWAARCVEVRNEADDGFCFSMESPGLACSLAPRTSPRDGTEVGHRWWVEGGGNWAVRGGGGGRQYVLGENCFVFYCGQIQPLLGQLGSL